MTVTKKDLTDLLSESIGLTAREGKEVVESFFDRIRAALVSGDNVLLSGFGVFRLRDNRRVLVAIPRSVRRSQ